MEIIDFGKRTFDQTESYSTEDDICITGEVTSEYPITIKGRNVILLCALESPKVTIVAEQAFYCLASVKTQLGGFDITAPISYSKATKEIKGKLANLGINIGYCNSCITHIDE